jgi:hypothetical protein
MLASAAAALYPTLLPPTGDPALNMNITIVNAAAGPHALAVGLIWWGAAMLLAIAWRSRIACFAANLRCQFRTLTDRRRYR